jgi:hypothetical protein
VRYLALVCPSNIAMGKYIASDKKYDLNTTRPSKQARVLAKILHAAFIRTAQGLRDPGFIWPAAIAKDITDVATGYYEDAPNYAAIAKGTKRTDLAPWVKASPATSRIRLALGLPPRSSGAAGGC